MRGSYKELVVPAQIEKLQEVLSFLEQALGEVDCPLKKQMQILAVPGRSITPFVV